MSYPFPFEDDGEPLELPEDDAVPSSRRTVLALAALAVTGVAAGAFLLLGGGGEDEALAVGVPPSATSPAAASPSPAPTPTAALPPATSVQVGGRDPFEPVFSESTAVARTATGTGTGSDTGTDPAPAGSGSQAPPPVDPSDASAVPPSASQPGPSVLDPVGPGFGPQVPTDGLPTDGVPSDGVPTDGVPTDGGAAGTGRPASVLLTRVTGTGTARSAVLALDGTPTRVDVGATFGPGGTLQLVSVQQGPEDGQWTAVLRSGDSDPFDVVSGVRTRLP